MKTSKFLPPAYFKICLLLAIGLHFIFPIRHLIHSPFRYTGIVLIGIGIWLNIWSDLLFKSSKTTVKPFENSTALVTEGPFRLSRHPMYLGMTAILLGLAVILGSLITFLVPVAFVIAMEVMFIQYEEKHMNAVFGEEYVLYRNKVRRWL